MNVKLESTAQTVLFAPVALTPEGWVENIRVNIDRTGRIAAVDIGATPQAGDDVLAGRILLPAPANLHSHAFQRAMAGLTESRGPDGQDSFWTWRRLMYRFLERIDPDRIEAIAALAYMEMLEAGYASVGEFHYLHHRPGGGAYDDPAETSARIAAAAHETGIGLTHLPVLYARGGADDRPLEGGQLRFGCNLDRFMTLYESAAGIIVGLPADARIGIAPHSLRAVSPDMLAEILRLSRGPVHIHIAEQTGEVEAILAALGARPVTWLLANADVDKRWCAVHATHMTHEEGAALARTGAVAGLCPITEANLGDGIFNGPDFLAAGGVFGIGSDSNVRIALAGELRTLEYSQRYRAHARAVLCPPGGSVGRALFDTALKGGAQALGRDAGAIAPGQWADLTALDADNLALADLFGDALLDAWIFAGDDTAVTDVWSAGRHVVTDGRHVKRHAIEARYRDRTKDLKVAP
jgi:formimidoylglutamate deiminase